MNEPKSKPATEFDKMIEFLDAAYLLKEEIVPCLVGPVGIGKTAAVRQHAKNVGAKNVVTIIASQILPNEVSGITMPDSETKAMEIYDHFRLSQLKDGDILFFDELLEADQLVLSACLTLIESRMLMSGRLLPNIQIIAATNPTIQPSVLKANIRQRFMFQKFDVDRKATRDYIKIHIGLDIEDLINEIECDNNEYNILSPRSLTKLAKWIMVTPEDQLGNVADVIDRTWHSGIGSRLRDLRIKQENKPEVKAKKAIIDAIHAVSSEQPTNDICFTDEEFESMSFEDIANELTSIGWWDDIAAILKNVNSPEEENVQSVSF